MSRRRKVKPMPMAATLEVRNPAYQPGHPEEIERVVVRRALRDDPLARLHARRQIGEAQYRAGRAWQAAYEAASIGHVGSIDPSNEPVDGSPKHAGPDLDRITKAARKLAGWDRLLGADGCAIVRDVLAEGRSMEQVAARRGECSQRSQDYFARRLRECLTSLARDMGYIGQAA